MDTTPLDPEEWERQRASVLEDARVLQTDINEKQATADMLRRRGHEAAAQHLETQLVQSQAVVDLVNATLGEGEVSDDA